jgi:hypothetical protein
MERIILRIRALWRLSLPEIHDRIVGTDCDESTFYLCYHAAKLLDE